MIEVKKTEKNNVKNEPGVGKTEPEKKEASARHNTAEGTKASTNIFTTKSEKKILNATKVNVLGRIDLDALNQSTRPKKKQRRRNARNARRR